jgi:hypothetical protein
VTLEEYEAWLNCAAPRVRPVPHPEIPGWYLDEPIEPLWSLAAQIWHDYELGLVVMTQAPSHVPGFFGAAPSAGGPPRHFAYYVSRTSKEL